MGMSGMRGLDLPEHENFGLNEYDNRSSTKGMGMTGRATQFSISPWNKTGQPLRSRYVEQQPGKLMQI